MIINHPGGTRDGAFERSLWGLSRGGDVCCQGEESTKRKEIMKRPAHCGTRFGGWAFGSSCQLTPSDNNDITFHGAFLFFPSCGLWVVEGDCSCGTADFLLWWYDDFLPWPRQRTHCVKCEVCIVSGRWSWSVNISNPLPLGKWVLWGPLFREMKQGALAFFV